MREEPLTYDLARLFDEGIDDAERSLGAISSTARTLARIVRDRLRKAPLDTVREVASAD
jgi:hypothetical protein